MKYLKSLAALFLVALFTLPAMAGGPGFIFPSEYVVTTMFASRLTITAPATTKSFNFTTQSRYVGICSPNRSTNITHYVRLGHTLTHLMATATADTTRMTIFAPTSAAFQDGVLDVTSGSISPTAGFGVAIPIDGGGDGGDQGCQLFPWRTRGITTFASVESGATTADLDVWVFPRGERPLD